ncbi:hypothetical protein V1477_000559 [Vespula maculifrons]|uniref:Uncharacterized protein n=1 Tax=Vespula maculifrons TaxID=7453 RepID=A0ABD2D211_VESMC
MTTTAKYLRKNNLAEPSSPSLAGSQVSVLAWPSKILKYLGSFQIAKFNTGETNIPELYLLKKSSNALTKCNSVGSCERNFPANHC